MSEEASAKNGKLALFLCLFFGFLGFHRFYAGKFITGFIMLITLGFFGLWPFVDLCFLVCNKFEDSKGKTIIVLRKTHPAIVLIPLILIWFFLAGAALAVLVFQLTSGVVNVTKEQVAALESGNIEKAYSYVSPAFKHATSMEQFEDYINNCPSLTRYEDTWVINREIKNNYGSVTMIRTSDTGEKSEISFRLINHNGEWMVQHMNCSPLQ